MSRLSLSLLALALGLGACDSATPSPSVDAVSLAPPTADAKSDAVHRVTEAVSIAVEGDVVLLEIEGERFSLHAGEAYAVGATLSRAGFDAVDPELAAEVFPPLPGGDKCEPPPPGSGVRLIDGRLFGGGGGCPPPPPRIFLEPSLLDKMFEGAVKIVEAPEVEWTPVPGGGYTAPY